jgi:hypothetical protein
LGFITKKKKSEALNNLMMHLRLLEKQEHDKPKSRIWKAINYDHSKNQ